ncbi:MAG: DUF481 domain-containing protein [Mariprofundus sp.]|nr:DUF481 domain-containing protein [Mariprofundus sp.]
MVYFLFAIFVFLAPMQAEAIINAENFDQALDADGVVGKFGLSVNGGSGHSVKLHSEVSAKLMWKHGRHTDLAILSYAYGKSNQTRDTNNAFIHLRHRYLFAQHWDLEAFGQVQQDEFARLKLRSLLGGGVRWSWKSDTWGMHLGAGSFYERESLRASVLPPSHLWRANLYAAVHGQLNDHVRLQDTLYYQPAWRYSNDFRLLNNAEANIVITDTLTLVLSLDIAHDSRPPAGVKPSDVSYKTGLQYSF